MADLKPLPSLTALMTAYPILSCLASHTSTLDLYNLARTCRANYNSILSSAPVFNNLRESSLCDGCGLLFRYRRPYPQYLMDSDYRTPKCDSANTQPCFKCGINTCRECRSYPREMRAMLMFATRLPHLDGRGRVKNVMCLCPTCDGKLHDDLAGPEGGEDEDMCKCDIFSRWICHACVREEYIATKQYESAWADVIVRNRDDFRYSHNTWAAAHAQTKFIYMKDHRYYYWCPCGRSIPQDMRVRCTLCKKRHCYEGYWPRQLRQEKRAWRLWLKEH
ncbi:hypothetical protein NKR23_g3714 [Pleurostoma richardsiae]|uniref:Uncharacterized protein n=1 Tax=Pleurostoma richardsiae TaxID=41990 RepID=A0AA38VW72_9PEZI|nr:hypothetical protein NKR23_g3714 [Pleurostoma richardsiae]